MEHTQNRIQSAFCRSLAGAGALVLSVGIASLSCERAPSTNNPQASSSAPGASSSGQLKTFEPGGAIELSAQGQNVTVTIGECFYNNTDPGYPDDIEINGPGSTVHFKYESKLSSNSSGDSDYKPLEGKPMPLWNEAGEPLEITMPGRGTYPIAAGTLTVERSENGMEGRDWWEGRLDLTLRTSQGEIPVSGTFKTCIIPVW
jgi:hypothetical protein